MLVSMGWGTGPGKGWLTTEMLAPLGKRERYSIKLGCTPSICSSTCWGSGVPSSLGVDAVCGDAGDADGGGAGVELVVGGEVRAGVGALPSLGVDTGADALRGFARCLKRRRERNLFVMTRVWPPKIASSSWNWSSGPMCSCMSSDGVMCRLRYSLNACSARSLRLRRIGCTGAGVARRWCGRNTGRVQSSELRQRSHCGVSEGACGTRGAGDAPVPASRGGSAERRARRSRRRGPDR